MPKALAYHNKNTLDSIISNLGHVEHAAVESVMTLLALCHTVVIDKRNGKFSSASPDEVALLEGAKAQGYEFIGKQEGGVMCVKIPSGDVLKYRLLNVLEFNSTRKRMSVVV